jgi:hypothetical protein
MCALFLLLKGLLISVFIIHGEGRREGGGGAGVFSVLLLMGEFLLSDFIISVETSMMKLSITEHLF